MPSLVPREQVTVHYLYFPPLLWADINTYVKSDEGLAKVLTVLPTPQAPAWQRRIALILLLVGVITIIYLGLAAIG